MVGVWIFFNFFKPDTCTVRIFNFMLQIKHSSSGIKARTGQHYQEGFEDGCKITELIHGVKFFLVTFLSLSYQASKIWVLPCDNYFPLAALTHPLPVSHDNALSNRVTQGGYEDILCGNTIVLFLLILIFPFLAPSYIAPDSNCFPCKPFSWGI